MARRALLHRPKRRKAARQARRERSAKRDWRHDRTEEWLHMALQAANMGAWVWEIKPGSDAIVRTEKYEQLMGVRRGAPWNREIWANGIYSEDRNETLRRMRSVVSGKQNEYNAEYRVMHKDNGGLRWLNSWGKNIRDASGEVVRVTGVVRDITDQKRLEQGRDQFVATLSHDLRNPLAAARTNAELLLRFHERLPDRDALLEKIVANIERADRMIQDLLDSSRLQMGYELQLRLESCDLSEVVSGVVEDLRGLYGERVSFAKPEVCQGMWSRDGVRRVLENLVGNAIKYGKEGTPVTVTLRRVGKELELSVHNFGEPIPPEQQETIFEPFQRAKVAQEGTRRGWGLGLTLVRGIAEAQGGRVEVRSNTTDGTTFSVFWLPSRNGQKRLRNAD